MKNQKVQFFITLITCMLFSGLVSVAASGHLFDSNEVVYDNTNSGMSSTNVKAAVDELYAAATDYSNINSRVSNLETNYNKYFLNNPTSRFNGNGLQLGVTGTSYGWLDWYNNGTNYGNIHASGNKFNIYSNYALEITGNPVKINNVNVSTPTSGSCTINKTYTSTGSASAVYYNKIGRVVIVNVYDVGPQGFTTGGLYTLATGLPEAQYQVATNLSGGARIGMSENSTELKWWWTSTSLSGGSGQLVYISKS